MSSAAGKKPPAKGPEAKAQKSPKPDSKPQNAPPAQSSKPAVVAPPKPKPVEEQPPAEAKGRKKKKSGKSEKGASKSPEITPVPEQKAVPAPEEKNKPEEKKESGIQRADMVDDSGEHKLETPWTFYFDKKLATHTTDLHGYKQNLKKLGTFFTLEGFWRYFAHLTEADKVPKDHDIYLFRQNLIPAWETFPNGGCWIIKVRKNNGIISRLWEELCFAGIAEMFGEPELTGVVLSSRGRDDYLSVWNRDNSKNPEVRFSIGEKLRTLLNLDESTKVEYKQFSAAIREGSTYRNTKTYVYAAQGYLPMGGGVQEGGSGGTPGDESAPPAAAAAAAGAQGAGPAPAHKE